MYFLYNLCPSDGSSSWLTQPVLKMKEDVFLASLYSSHPLLPSPTSVEKVVLLFSHKEQSNSISYFVHLFTNRVNRTSEGLLRVGMSSKIISTFIRNFNARF